MRRHAHGHFGRKLQYHGVSKLSIDEQETLEQLMEASEKEETISSSDIASRMKIPHLGDILDSLEAKKLIKRSNRSIFLSESGAEEALAITRRNRLAQVLFTQAFDLPYNKAAEIACKFEHLALSDDVTDSICTFLGHPPQSPDGRAIPPGKCCRESRKNLVPIVKRLTDLNVGDTGTVVFVAPGSHSVLDRLSSFGIIPGEKIKMHQKNPSFVIQFSYTTMALEEEVAQNIFVRVRVNED